MMVNVGAFTGKTIIDPLRNVIGEQAYIYINYFSGAMTIVALLAVILLYKSTHTAGEGKSLHEIGQGFMRIITNWRLLILILIVTGFWMVQQQLYATMPKYVIRMAGETAKPGWIANVNPFVVVCCVSFITRLMAKRRMFHFTALSGIFLFTGSERRRRNVFRIQSFTFIPFFYFRFWSGGNFAH